MARKPDSTRSSPVDRISAEEVPGLNPFATAEDAALAAADQAEGDDVVMLVEVAPGRTVQYEREFHSPGMQLTVTPDVARELLDRGHVTLPTSFPEA